MVSIRKAHHSPCYKAKRGRRSIPFCLTTFCFHRPEIDNSGISAFWQLGWNHAKTLPMNKFVGLGFTAFALTRPSDSFGAGMAWAWLNKRIFTRNSELMFQAYYQAHLFHHSFLIGLEHEFTI